MEKESIRTMENKEYILKINENIKTKNTIEKKQLRFVIKTILHSFDKKEEFIIYSKPLKVLIFARTERKIENKKVITIYNIIETEEMYVNTGLITELI